MKFLNDSIARFARWSMRERLLALAAVAAVLYFSADFALLGPQQKKIKAVRDLGQANTTELASINQVLAQMENAEVKARDPLARERATVAALKKQIADVDAFFGQADPTTSQIGALVRELLDANPKLTLVSLKTLSPTEFYSPANAAPASGNAAKDVKDNREVPKTVYRHGVEVSIKGNYLALLAYLENLQKTPGRLFWSEARLDVSTYPESVLKVVIYTLSDQPSAPLG